MDAPCLVVTPSSHSIEVRCSHRQIGNGQEGHVLVGQERADAEVARCVARMCRSAFTPLTTFTILPADADGPSCADDVSLALIGESSAGFRLQPRGGGGGGDDAVGVFRCLHSNSAYILAARRVNGVNAVNGTSDLASAQEPSRSSFGSSCAAVSAPGASRWDGRFVLISAHRSHWAGRVVDAKQTSSLLQHAKVKVECIANGSTTIQDVEVRQIAAVLPEDVVLTFNTKTLPPMGRFCKEEAQLMLLPRDPLGPSLLALPGNYALTASLEHGFVARLLEHGLFVLPARQIFSCPFPETPFVFLLQEGSCGSASSWGRSKMLRRYRNDFELSCNEDFAGHLRLCGQYHEERGGTWISDELIDVMVALDRDPTNRIRMYCFELWDKSTGALAAASFGLAIGTFFHDFSMCCLIRDKRACGAVLTKAIGALLTDCGVDLWYWGRKMQYMSEYEAHGAKEIARADYYYRLRKDINKELFMDPAAAILAGKALVQQKKLLS